MRGLLVVALVIAGLAIGGDFLVRSAVERELEQRLEGTLGSSRDVEVSLPGFPLTLQLLRGRLDRIDAEASDARAGELRLDKVNALARNVRFSLASVLGGDGRIRVGRARATASLTEDAINDALRSQGLDVSVVISGDGATVSGGNIPASASASAEVATDGDSIVIIGGGFEVARLDVTPESGALTLRSAELRRERVALEFAVAASVLSQ